MKQRTHETRRLSPLRLAGRFLRERSGASAIEFAILAFPFFLLLFGILELCIIFGAQQLMTNATDDLTRQIRTGQIRPDDLSESEFGKMLCDRMTILFPSGCPGLTVNLQNKPTFAEAALIFSEEDVPPPPAYDPGGPLSKNVLRVYYEWPVITAIMRSRISNISKSETLLFATHTWQNEPY